MKPTPENLPFADLPGGDLIAQGLEDLKQGIESIPSLLVQIGSPKLRRLSLDIPEHDASDPLPEHRLYFLLAKTHGDHAHSQYNALIRKLVSFHRAAACVS